MKKLLVLVTILSTFALTAYAGSHSKKVGKGDISKADYLKQAEASFDRMDADKDGILTVAEKKAYNAKLKAAREAKKAKEGTKPQTK